MADSAGQLFFDFSEFGGMDSAISPAKPLSPRPLPSRPASGAPETIVFPAIETFKPYGAWADFNSRLSTAERNNINRQTVLLLEKEASALTAEEKTILRSYSGWGGLAASNERGVLYDYYTSPPIADMTWRLLHAISPIAKGSRVLEPSCGTGVFFETAPEGLELHGVELDQRSAAVASRVHPSATIVNQSFEAFNVAHRDNLRQFDYVIGNIPFGDRTLETAFLDMREEKSLDRYFISRALDNLKPGGAMAIIAHSGVLANKTNEEWRLGIARKAQFRGAIRLNDHSFFHSHSTVQPDILFFTKHPTDITQRLSILSDSAIQKTAFGAWVDNGYDYFTSRPLHVMGRISEGTGQWGHDEIKGTVDKNDLDAMTAAFAPEAAFAAEYQEARNLFPLPEPKKAKKSLSLNEAEQAAVADKALTAGSIKTADDSAYVLSGDFRWIIAVEHNPSLTERLDAIKAISDAIKAIRLLMRQGEKPNDYQTAAKAMLAAYQTRHQTLPKDDGLITRFLKNNPAVSGVYEAFIDSEADILNKPSLYDRGGEIILGHNEAVSALLQFQKRIEDGTEAAIRKIFPETADGLIAEMYRNSNIFLSPNNVWQLREDFISGNAWEKIDALAARAEIETDQAKKKKILYGKSELEKAVGWTPIEEADFSPHASWIPEYIVNRWVSDEDGLDRSSLVKNAVISKNEEGKWGRRYVGNEIAYNKGKRHDVYEGQWEELADELIYYLNMQKQRIRYIDTKMYNQEQNDNFKNYIANHTDFRDELERQYNRIFKTELSGPVKTYPIYLEGWQTGVKAPRDHQWQTIHHLFRQEKGISALGTGFGKTLAAIGLYALLAQERKIKRAWLQVPNNKVKDWVKEIHDVLPNLKVGFVDPETRGYSSREVRYALYQRLANSDYDIILLPESAASEIQLAPEHDQEITDEIISKHLVEKANATERAQETAKENTARKLENGKTNQTIYFEDFGCDAIFVDEAHRFKNLFTSSLSRETGLNDGRTSAKAMALFKKTEYVRRQNGGKNIFLLTATPLTNSPLEYYNMLMFVAPEELEKFGIFTIDGFIKNFATIEEGYVYDWKTGNVASKRILTGFKNIQTLQNIFFKYTDYQNDPKKINLIKPDARNTPNVIPINALQTAVLKTVSEELEAYINCPKEDREDQFPHQNFLTFYSRMRTASLDLELFNPEVYKDWENPKLKKLAETVRAIYEKTNAGQVVFGDRVFSSDGSFNMHEKIRRYLTNAGFKAYEIVIVNGFTKSGGTQSDSAVEKEVSQAVAAFNSGRYKVLVGSTACIGEGLNLQENSAALHHFDIPYRPSDFIQRNGRVDRQGNRQTMVELHTYMSAGTIDNYSVALVQRKANWIDKLLKTKSHVFLNPNDDNYLDSDELLLALTEEWGDAEKTAQRREERERTKELKIQETRNAQRRDHLAALSMLRGALASFGGNQKSAPYQTRLRKIANIESALHNNSSFVQHDFLEKKMPFLYSKSIDQIIQKGDMLYCYGKPYEVVYLNIKKQEILAKPLRKETQTSYQPYRSKTIDGAIELEAAKLKIKNNFKYFSQLDDFNSAYILSLDSKQFFTIPEKIFKEKHYHEHLDLSVNKSNFNTVRFFKSGNNDDIIITHNEHIYDKGNEPQPILLNPFNEHDRKQIEFGLANGPEFNNEYSKNEDVALIKEFYPEFFKLLPKRLVSRNVKGVEDVPEPSSYSGLKANTADNFKDNVVLLMNQLEYKEKPFEAVQSLIAAASPKVRLQINKELMNLGCTDEYTTKKVILSWGAMPENAAAYALKRSLHRKDKSFFGLSQHNH
jgi:superfamily II DNA or RNA helicase